MALLGMKKEVLTSAFVWLCSSCYACQERCPQGVKITGIMGAIRNIAVKNRLVPAMFSGQVASLKAHGRVYEVGELENEKRAKLGLPQINNNIQTLWGYDSYKGYRWLSPELEIAMINRT